jgi:hypothetical protein
VLGPVGAGGRGRSVGLGGPDDVDDPQPGAGGLSQLAGELQGRTRLRSPVVADPDRLELPAAVGVARRRDDHGARGAVERARGDVARQHATDAPAVSRADDDEVGAFALGDQMQGPRGRAVRDSERSRPDLDAVELFLQGLSRGAVHGGFEAAARGAADVVVAGIGVHGGQLACGQARQRTGQDQCVPPALAGVDADDDRLEHGVAPSSRARPRFARPQARCPSRPGRRRAGRGG